jgi:glycosyltransferase involved in cell wall biosynthesis
MLDLEYPPISCKCITYGRVNLLEESIESFLKQDYPGKKELVIINDYPLQTLEFSHPEVKIINLPETFITIGEKENFAVNSCSYDIIAVWDDDDIAMPNHLRNIAKYFKKDTDLLHWHRGVFFNGDDITDITGLGNSGIVYSRKAWQLVGGHPLENAGYDMTFVMAIRHASQNVVFADPSDEEVSWFYMWGGRSYHMSGQGTDIQGMPSVILRHAQHVERERLRGLIPTGRVVLKPKWRRDYKKKLNEFVKNKSIHS